MAITDNTFTPEELTAAVAANPALKDHLVGAVKSAGYVARTADEENTFIGSKVKEIHDRYDQDVFDMSGIQKEQNEKSYDFTKRALKTLKESATPLQTKIAELEKQIQNGNGDATLKAQLEQLQQKEATWQEEQKKLTGQLFEKDVKLDIRDGLRGLKLDTSVKESIRNVMVDNATAKLLSQAKLQKNADGSETVVYVDGDKTRLDKDGKPADAAYLLAEELKDIIEAGHPGAGGGAGPGGGGAPGGTGRKALPATIPATIKTQGQLMDYFKEFGLGMDTKEYDEAWDKFNGDKLPL